MQRTCYVLIEQMQREHGTETLAALMLDGLRRQGHRVRLFTGSYSPKQSAWASFLRQRDIDVVHPGFWFMTGKWWPQRIAAKLLWLAARKHKPDFIWTPDNGPVAISALKLRRPTDVPFFVHDPSEAGPDCPHYYSDWFKVCDRVTGLSVHGQRQAKSAREYYKYKGNIKAIWPASFSPERAVKPPACNKPIRFGQFGRLASMKGTLFTVGAFNKLIRRGLSAELHFFGDGPTRVDTQELVNSLGLGPLVSFHGRYQNIELDNLVETIDVGLMNSTYEGFGLVMLELMSRGRPVIASDVGSSREVLEGLGGGWIVQRADTESMAEAMSQCVNAPGMVVAKGAEASRVWQEYFTTDLMLKRYFDFWKACGCDI
jgi:glycosyltransferase involved in cell wall biosynthesis